MSISSTVNDAFGSGGNEAGTKIDKAADSAHATLNTLSNKAHDAVNKVVPAVEAVTDRAHDVIDNAASAIAPAVATMAQRAHALDDKREHMVNNARQCVRERPAKNLLIALGAGYLLAKIL